MFIATLQASAAVELRKAPHQSQKHLSPDQHESGRGIENLEKTVGVGFELARLRGQHLRYRFAQLSAARERARTRALEIGAQTPRSRDTRHQARRDPRLPLLTCQSAAYPKA